jgi:hypothetical protein
MVVHTVTTALGEEAFKFETSLGYTMRPWLKKKKKQANQKPLKLNVV